MPLARTTSRSCARPPPKKSSNGRIPCLPLPQVALECLLHEKTEDQAKVISLEARLLEARDAVDNTEAEIHTVTSELKRVECLNSELLEAATPTPPAVALLDRQRLEARLEGLRVAVEEEDEENGVQVRRRWGWFLSTKYIEVTC